MSARCPDGHLSHNNDYCDHCGLQIGGVPDGYSRRADEYPPRSAPQGTQAQQPYGGDEYGRPGYGEPAAAPDPLGARRAPADTRGVADPPRGYAPERPMRPGDYSGYGRDGYAENPMPMAPPAEAYREDPYGRDPSPRGRGGRDYAPDDPYGGGTVPRGRGGEARGGYGHDGGYGRPVREDDADRLAPRATDPYGYPLASDAHASRSTPAPTPPGLNTPEAGGRYAPCPNCRTLQEPGARYCETCGMDFVSGHAPAPAPVDAAPYAPSPTPLDDDRADAYGDPRRSGGSRAQNWDAPGVTAWEAVVEAEREYYDSGDDHRVPFPAFYPRRVFALDSPQLLVGRRSESRGIHPQIDLSGAPEDPGISRAHAMFEQMSDGTYAVLDPGSTNGTRLNDEPEPIEPGQAVPLRDGDRVYLGAWTRITVRARTR